MYISGYPIDRPAVIKDRPKNTSRVIIIDRSGSMWHEITHVIDNVVQMVNALPEGDTISIGWFSSEGGLFRFELVGHVLSSDRSAAVRVLNNMRNVKNLTCFSEIMADAQNVINTLTAFGLPITLIFHSDGYPVVRDLRVEEMRLFTAINNIRHALSEVLVVGYGEYYNRALLSRMADALGGKLMHSQNYVTWGEILGDHLYPVTSHRRTIHVKEDGIWFDSIGNVYERSDNGTILVPDDLAEVFCLDATRRGGDVINDTIVYTAARVLLTKERVDEAVEVLTALGDVAAAEKVASAWTPQEFGKVADYLETLATNPTLRFEKGCHPGQKPALDAPCLLDVLDTLMADPDARFWIDRGFQYKRIGTPKVPVDGTPKFVQEPDLALSLTDLVWNEKRLNLSARFVIPGKAEIGKNDLGLPAEYPCVKFRTFAFVNDGRLNTTQAAFSMSHETFDKLNAWGVIIGQIDNNNHVNDLLYWFKGVPYLVDFSAVPLVNGKIALSAPSTQDIFDDVMELLRFEADLRVMNSKSKILKTAGIVETEEGLTTEQQESLASLGIVKGVFRPKMVEGEATDSYLAPTLEIAVKGFSSLPSPDKVYDKVKEGKKLTPSEMLVKEASDDFDANQPKVESAEKLLEWIEQCKRSTRACMTEIRSRIQRAKFAVLLGHKWFEGVDRNDPQYEFDGMTILFKMGQETIEI